MSADEKNTKADPTINVETKSISSTANTLVNEDQQPVASSASQVPTRVDKGGRPMADPGFTWGRTPKGPFGDEWKASTHPVDNMSEEKQAKLRAKGINPALKAEMDEKVYQKGRWKTTMATMLNIK
ncbi:MAG: hypothetical protein M4579_000793 [Chaenotheca gracillima]|nr:MAG: hypothetical protein M4579_000793 [Chaenotheca gracillima]